jgi:glycosyltransferase involved in cell wall biosynthesis
LEALTFPNRLFPASNSSSPGHHLSPKHRAAGNRNTETPLPFKIENPKFKIAAHRLLPMNPVEIPPRCLGVVIPVYNEEKTLYLIVGKVLSRPEVAELVIVNDFSSDGTWQTMQELAKTDDRIRIFTHEVNQGKGAALRTGFQHVNSDIVIIQDADLEYDPDEYPKLLTPILMGRADVVFGSRFLGSGMHRVLYYWHCVGNRFLTLLSNMFTNLNLTDMETCYKVFRRGILKQITIEENRFGFEPEITAKVARLGVPLYEVSISYYGRTYEEGKKIGWRDGLRAIWCILKYNFFR